ncbi:MAG: hypothetical protein JXB32_17570 [Deltaproteobacteria bacterium]|nr:hypothetical protein [Deltaproteobacteria bacterium]
MVRRADRGTEMPGQTVFPWSVAASLIAAGCSGGSGTTVDDADGGDSSVTSDHVSSEGEEGSFDTADAEPPPVAPPHCGDGVLDPDEECDDGNRLDGDDCDWLCRLGPGEPVDDTPDPSVADLERDLPWTSVVSPLPAEDLVYSESLCLLWTGSAYATVWNLESVDPDGVPRQGAGFRLFDRVGRRVVPDWTYHYPDRVFGSLDLAWSGRFFALVWSTGGGEDPGCLISAMILDHVGKPLVGPFTLVEGPRCGPATVTWDGEAFAAVWRWDDDGGAAIGIARFDELGSILSVVPSVYEAPFARLSARSASSPVATVTAFAETPEVPPGLDDTCRLGWLAATRDAELLRPPAELGQATTRPMTIEWGERRFGLAFVPAYTPTDAVHLALLDAAGMLVGPVRQVCECWLCHQSMAMAWGAGGWVIACDIAPGVGGIIRLMRTDASGTLVATTDLGDVSRDRVHAISMAFDGEGFGLLGWTDWGLLFTRYVVVP